MSTLFLIRHGFAVSNEQNHVTGAKSACLTFEGAKLAAESSSTIRKLMPSNKKFEAMVSPLNRAVETAHLLLPDADWIAEERLAETDGGTVAELTVDQFQAKYGCRQLEYHTRYPGGESHSDLEDRVNAWFHERVSAQVDLTVVVTHAGPINMILHRLYEIDSCYYPFFELPNLSLTKLEICRQGRLIQHETFLLNTDELSMFGN